MKIFKDQKKYLVGNIGVIIFCALIVGAAHAQAAHAIPAGRMPQNQPLQSLPTGIKSNQSQNISSNNSGAPAEVIQAPTENDTTAPVLQNSTPTATAPVVSPVVVARRGETILLVVIALLCLGLLGLVYYLRRSKDHSDLEEE